MKYAVSDDRECEGDKLRKDEIRAWRQGERYFEREEKGTFKKRHYIETRIQRDKHI